MDKKEALKQIKAGDFSLADANEKLKADKDVVLVAVKQYGSALQYADDQLKADKDVVLEALKESGDALEYADDKLKTDKEIVLLAIKNSWYGNSALQYADKKLRADKKIILEAIKEHHSLLRYADESLQKEIDPTFLYSESNMTGLELNYWEFSINEKDINSVQKIKDFFSDDNRGGAEDFYIKGLGCDPTNDSDETGLLLGTISKNDKNKLASLDLSIDDEDVDFSNIKIDYNIGQKPGKGKINLTFYYYMKDSYFKLKTYKKNKKFCLSVGSFENLAIAPSDASDEETQEFEYALQGNDGGESMYKFRFVFDDGKIIECDSDRNELIESISKYLISKGAFNK